VFLKERKSGLALFYKVERRTKEKIEVKIKQLLSLIADKVHTITSDNGKESANHDTIVKELVRDFYLLMLILFGKKALIKKSLDLSNSASPKTGILEP